MPIDNVLLILKRLVHMPDAEEPAVRPAASSSTNDFPSGSFINEGSDTV